MVLLVWPLIAVFIGAAWAHEGIDLYRPARYIRGVLEIEYSTLGWETHLENSMSYRGTMLHRISTWGLFGGSQLIAVAIYFAASNFPTLSELNADELVFLVLDLFAFCGTIAVYLFQRAEIRSFRGRADGSPMIV